MILRDWLFALLTISGVTIGFSSLWVGMASKYAVKIPVQDLALYNTLGNVSTISSTLQGNTTGIANIVQNIPILGSFASIMVAGVQSVIVMLTVVPSVFGNLLTSMGNLVGLPGWFMGLITSAVVLTIIWSIISQTIVKGRV